MKGPEITKGKRSREEESKSTHPPIRKYEVTRLEYIRLKLKRGDKKRIAEALDVHPEWVSQVIRGKGISEPVLCEAERLIHGGD